MVELSVFRRILIIGMTKTIPSSTLKRIIQEIVKAVRHHNIKVTVRNRGPVNNVGNN